MDNRFVKGLLRDNPLLCLALGVCPALAVTTYAVNGLALGVTFAILLMNVATPVIDRFTKRRVYGYEDNKKKEAKANG